MKKLLLLLFLIPNLVMADNLWIQGEFDCGLWLDVRKANNSSEAESAVMSFANGYAFGSQLDVWRKPTQISASQLNYIVDQKCRDEPTSDVWPILESILYERGLSKKQKQ